MSPERSLLVITDPAARSADGESVRVALDVLRASAPAKVVVPADADELRKALARRGRRRLVVIGADGGIQAVARALDAGGELADTPLGIVPVDTGYGITALTRALSLPDEPAKAARAALGDREQPLDLMCDGVGGLVLRSVRIGQGVRALRPQRAEAGAATVLGRGWRSLLDRAARAGTNGQRLRVEADGRVIADVDRPVLGVHLGCMPHVTVQERSVNNSGLARLSVTSAPGGRFGLPAQTRGRQAAPAIPAARGGSGSPLVEVRAREITVCGTDFTYEADGRPTGPVRLRTWTLRQEGWRLYAP